MSKQVILWTLLIAVCLLFGCAQKQVQYEPICLADTNIETAMKKAEMALLKMHFTIDKADPVEGIIITKPLAGGQTFEFWQQDNRDGYSRAMADLHSIRRTAILNFSKKDNWLCIDCNVTIERLSMPEKQIDSSTRAFSMFSRSNETRQTLRLDSSQERLMEWVNLGRDSNLEAAILKKIHKGFEGKK